MKVNYESRYDKRGVDLMSDALPFARLWYGGPNAVANAVRYAKFYSCSYNAVIRIYDEAGNVIEMQEHKGDFREPWVFACIGLRLMIPP